MCKTTETRIKSETTTGVSLTLPTDVPKEPSSSEQPKKPLSARKQTAIELANGYTASKRFFEAFCLSVWGLALLAAIFNVVCSVTIFHHIPAVLIGSTVALFMGDFCTGVVHWSFDTWGTLEIPVVGQSFIRSFREHHVDPFAITHHDFIQCNGDSCVLIIPILAVLSRLSIENSADVAFQSYFIVICVVTTLTNQVHKWAHQLKPPALVSLLQRGNILLSRSHHSKHHRPPFDKAYCITNGWATPVLSTINFWKGCEKLITFVCGAIPREDDNVWTDLVTFKK